MDDQEMMKLRRVAKLLDLHYQTVWKWVRDKKVPAVKIGGSWRIRKSDLEKYINEQDNN